MHEIIFCYYFLQLNILFFQGMIENQDCDMSRGQNFSFVLHNLELGAKYQVSFVDK